jgi:hypothetical protein
VGEWYEQTGQLGTPIVGYEVYDVHVVHAEASIVSWKDWGPPWRWNWPVPKALTDTERLACDVRHRLVR